MVKLSPLVRILTAGIVFSAGSLLAQAPVPRPKVIPGAASHPRQVPCWEQAGISKATIEQRRQIELSTRAEVQAVCAESGLSLQQKHEKIREIRQHAQEEIKTLITPQQQEALRACQQERSSGRHLGSGGNRSAGVGPCGETPTAKTPSP